MTRLIDEDTLDLIKGIIDSYENSPQGIFCREVAITERELEAIKAVYEILKKGDKNV